MHVLRPPASRTIKTHTAFQTCSLAVMCFHVGFVYHMQKHSKQQGASGIVTAANSAHAMIRQFNLCCVHEIAFRALQPQMLLVKHSFQPLCTAGKAKRQGCNSNTLHLQQPVQVWVLVGDSWSGVCVNYKVPMAWEDGLMQTDFRLVSGCLLLFWGTVMDMPVALCLSDFKQK